MRSRLVLVPLLVLGLVPNIRAQDDYQPGPDSLVQAGVPKGELIKGTYTAKEGSVFPGTERDYTIYLPPSTGSGPSGKPSPFMVFQDGVIYNAPVVFDNLIAKGQIPPLIGIFIKPGIVPAANPNALPRYNRSYEYDSVSDTYSRFLIDEFLSAIKAKHGFKLSTDPNDAAISGNSSGGICAFMAAWHRPDRIRRVFSGVGTYVGIHGADQLPVLVRKFEPKPLRIYLQSGEHDNDLYCGDWWMANQTMERALKWAGYDVNHTWGTGGHNGKHATSIFPDVLRWLWRDYGTAKQIKANPRGESKWKGYEVVGEWEWEVAVDVGIGKQSQTRPFNQCQQWESLTSNMSGEVFAAECSNGTIIKLGSDDKKSVFVQNLVEPRVLGISPDGRLFVNQQEVTPNKGTRHTIVGYNAVGTSKPVGQSYNAFSLSFAHKGLREEGDGLGYVASKEAVAGHASDELTISILYADGQRVRIDDDKAEHEELHLVLSPDQTKLYAASKSRRFVTSYVIQPNGLLQHAQEYYQLETKDDGIVEASGLCVDTNGWLYVATALGIQVCDQAGRVNFIIPTPQQPHDLCFGGKDLGDLFIACGDKIYKRPTKAHGIVSGQMAPIKRAPPKL